MESDNKTPEQRLDECIAAWRAQIVHAAKAENEYRKLRQEKRVKARAMPELKLADDRKEWVDSETADQRMERDIAAEMLKTYPEEARNIRQVMSYKQSEMKAAGGLE